jgi:hypothetical protein
MRARIRRPATLLIATVVASGVAPATATAVTGGTRSRPEPGPIARPVVRAVHRMPSAPAATPSTAAPHGTAGRPVSSLRFDAIPQQNGFYPADPTGAIGETSIVTAVNTSVAVYGRDGALRLTPTSLDSLTPDASGERFDPRVVYDQYTRTFVLIWLIRNVPDQVSLVGVTTIPDATAATTSTWCTRTMPGDAVDANGPQWSDYPAIGYDASSVVITTNAFNLQQRRGFAYSQIYHVANADLFTSTCPDTIAATVFAQGATRDPDGSKAFTLQPAQTVGASNGDQYFLSYDESGAAMVVWRLGETAMGSASLRRKALPVSRARISPYGTQRGGSYRDDDTWWDPGDLRLVNAFYDADTRRLYAAHAVLRDLRPDAVTGGYAEAAIRWYEVRPMRRLTASKLTRVGIVGAPETDAGWPVVATDAAGNLFVTYNRASKARSEYLSAWAAEIAPGTTRSRSTLLAAGTARFEALPGVERWGDFNAIGRDPLDGSSVAMINQYARSDSTGTSTQDWQQTFDLVGDG